MVNLVHRPLDDLKLAALVTDSASADINTSQAAEFDVEMTQLQPTGLLNLRLDANDAAAKQIAETVIGSSLPLHANTRSLDGSVWWLAPDEWMLTHASRADTQSLQTRLTDALAPFHHSVVDVSHQFEGLRVSGPLARDLLAHIVTLDLHPRVLKTNSVAQTVAAHCQITLLTDENGTAFDLYTRRSFVTYLWRRLADAAADMDLNMSSR